MMCFYMYYISEPEVLLACQHTGGACGKIALPPEACQEADQAHGSHSW